MRSTTASRTRTSTSSRAPLSQQDPNTSSTARRPRGKASFMAPTTSSRVKKARTSSSSSSSTRSRERFPLARPTRASQCQSRTSSSSSSTARTSSSRASAARASTARASTARASTARASSSTSRDPQQSNSRKKWDIKGRLEDLEQFTHSLKDQVKMANSNVEQLEAQLRERESRVSALETVKSEMQSKVVVTEQEAQQMAQKRRELLRQMESMKSDYEAQVDQLKSDLRRLQSRHEDTQTRLSVVECERDRLRLQSQQLQHDVTERDEQLVQSRAQVESVTAQRDAHEHTIGDLRLRITALEEHVEQLEERKRSDEMLRRKLHDHIQQLKGNIRVFCRVRPFLESEEEDGEHAYAFPDHNTDKRSIIATSTVTSGATSHTQSSTASLVRRRSTSGAAATSTKEYSFTFDRVFGPCSGQEEVFDEIGQLVQSALDGYHSCIFAYGQTGSGKTYTMEGPPRPDPCSQGMIPRAVDHIFSEAQALADMGWSFRMTALFVEIYNETINDLLSHSSDSSSSTDYRIVHDKSGNTTVTGVTTHDVTHPQQVHSLLKRAARRRSTAFTECNDRSSRSHSVFRLVIEGENSHTSARTTGVLNLIDLAGSERLSSSKVTGKRLRETQNINKSLSCLGDVIAALANKDKHVPYRNSKLTYLLQHSLGGNAKTLMFVNVSPRASDLSESLSSLRFATKVNACEIGVARKGGRMNLSQ